jgi:hypothetical protein
MAGYIGNQAQIRSGLSATIDELNIIDGVTATTTELNYNDTGAAVGTVVASKTVTADANKDVASFRNITLTGELDAGSLDISGNADIDGTLETDALSIAGVTVTATAAELNLIDGGTARGTTAVADGDGLLVNDAGTMRMTTVQTVKTFMTAGLGTPAIVFPSNWASPTNNYTSSATWSKGSLADDDYVWFYLLNSGGGGGTDRPGFGGMAMLLYATAATLNGAAYTIGAAKAGQNSAVGTIQNPTTVTLTSGNGSLVFTPEEISTTDDTSGDPTLQTNIRSIGVGGVISTYLTGFPAASYTIQTGALPTNYGAWTISNGYQTYQNYDGDCVFGGGVGYTTIGSANAAAVSLFAGNGGASLGAAPGSPGGGGAQGDGETGTTGAAGSLRVYHV